MNINRCLFIGGDAMDKPCNPAATDWVTLYVGALL